MFQAFVILLREGFESFLIIAIILAYLVKIGRRALLPAVYWGIAASVFASAGMGCVILQTADEPLWEGVFGLAGAVLVATFVIHMWRTASHLKKDMEVQIDHATAGKPNRWALLAVFSFTVFMMTREGMEMAFLLIQVHESRIITGILMGILAASGMAFLWTRFARLINLKLFFQVTSVFLLLFVLQVLIYSFHEFTEAGLLPHSQALHAATEPFSPEGIYGRWLTLGMIGVSAAWLLGAWAVGRLSALLLILFFFSLPGTAFAHARNYVWTEEYKTLPQNEFELENWVTFKVQHGARSNANTIQYQEELEYGITDHWNIAHYERWKTKNGVGPDDSTVYEGFKFETKYRIGEKGKFWVDPLLYLELETDVREEHRQNKLEGKIVLSKDFGKWNLTYNQIMESELDNGGRTEHEYRNAASVEILSGVRLGGELVGNYWKPGSHRNEISIGPTLAYQGKYFWIATGVALGANRGADDFQARIILGIDF